MAAKYSIVPEEKGIITEHLLKNLSDVSNDDDHTDLITAKVVSIIVLGLGSFFLGLLPLQLAKWFSWKFNNSQTKSNNLVISLLLCFGGGVLMFTTFIHLQPEVREEMHGLIDDEKVPDFEHFADLIFCLGFFFVYFIEEVVHFMLDQKHHHSEDETCLHRTVSLRKCNKGKDPDCDQSEGVIPKISLNQEADEKSLETSCKSTSTQVLIDSSRITSIYDTNGNTSFEENYPTKPVLINSETQIMGGKLCFYPEYRETNEVPEKDTQKNKYYENNFQPVGKGSPKGHSHLPAVLDGETSDNYVNLSKTFRGFFTVLALSFHAVFEGLAVGLENKVSDVWYLCLAIATHKFVISFCVGVDLLSTRTKVPLIILYLGTFAFVTPLGIGIGTALSDHEISSPELSTVILQGMAAGTLLYVVFFEVLQREKANEQSGILQLIAILAGFAVMLGLQMIFGHDHHHHHHHEHRMASLDVSQLSTPPLHFNEPGQRHFVSPHKH